MLFILSLSTGIEDMKFRIRCISLVLLVILIKYMKGNESK